MRQCGVVPALLRVANYLPENYHLISVDEAQTVRFQNLKARIALSWILAAEGLYGGQAPKSLPSDPKLSSETALRLSDIEVRTLVQLLSNVLHHRMINGAPSSSAATLSLKCLLYAVRCLLANYQNRELLAALAGPKLNILLLKVIALRSTNHVSLEDIDLESAENALDSLYLLSSFGFKHVFLPRWLFAGGTSRSFISKTLIAFEKSLFGNIAPTTEHAKDQLLLRIKYLCFDELLVASPKFFLLQLPASDMKFTPALLVDLQNVNAETKDAGASPLVDIHDQPVIRAPALQSINGVWLCRSALFENPEAVNKYPSALLAAQQLSREDKQKAMGLDCDDTIIDEVLIANVIVTSTNKRKDCFGYSWRWGDLKPSEEKQKSPLIDLVSDMLTSSRSFTCGTMTEVYWGRPTV